MAGNFKIQLKSATCKIARNGGKFKIGDILGRQKRREISNPDFKSPRKKGGKIQNGRLTCGLSQTIG